MPTSGDSALILTTIPIIFKIIILFWKFKVHQRLQKQRNKTQKTKNKNHKFKPIPLIQFKH